MANAHDVEVPVGDLEKALRELEKKRQEGALLLSLTNDIARVRTVKDFAGLHYVKRSGEGFRLVSKQWFA